MEWGRLQLEQSTLIMHGRIEHIAREHLKMTVPAAASIQIVSINEAENRLDAKGLKP